MSVPGIFYVSGNTMNQKGEGNMIAEKVLKHNKSGIAGGTLVALGIVAALTVTIVLTLLQSLLVTTQKISMHSSSILSYAIWIVSAIIGTLVGIRQSQTRKIIIAGIIWAGYLIILMIISLIVFSGKLERVLPGMISSMAGSIIGCMIKIAGQKGKHRRWK